MISRRDFLKRAGVMAVAAAGAGSLPMIGTIKRAACAQTTPGRIAFDDKETLESLRAKIEHNGYKFTVGRNWCYDGFGYPGTPDPPDELTGSPLLTVYPYSDVILGSAQTSLSSFDLRNVNGHTYISPVRNQAGTGLCWAFGACAAAEGSYNRKNGLYDGACEVFSPMYMNYTQPHGGSGTGVDNLWPLTKYGEPGVNLEGLEGVCREVDFPFAANYQQMGSPASPPPFRIERSKLAPRILLKRAARVFPADYNDTTTQIKAAIYKYGAVSVAIVLNAAVRAYKSGVYEDTDTEPDRDPYWRSTAGHAVALIGWDDNPPEGGEGGCWILRNSFGRSWGENGYMRIRYQSGHINCQASFIEACSPDDGELALQGMVTVGGAASGQTTVTLTGDDTFAVTSYNGYFFPALKPGRYVVTPTQPSVIFVPPFREIVLTNQSVIDADFAG